MYCSYLIILIVFFFNTLPSIGLPKDDVYINGTFGSIKNQPITYFDIYRYKFLRMFLLETASFDTTQSLFHPQPMDDKDIISFGNEYAFTLMVEKEMEELKIQHIELSEKTKKLLKFFLKNTKKSKPILTALGLNPETLKESLILVATTTDYIKKKTHLLTHHEPKKNVPSSKDNNGKNEEDELKNWILMLRDKYEFIPKTLPKNDSK